MMAMNDDADARNALVGQVLAVVRRYVGDGPLMHERETQAVALLRALERRLRDATARSE